MRIDTTFDFRTDTPPGKDPDTFSPILRKYHQLLWSKPLQNGVLFELEDVTPYGYLYHQSEMGEFWLSSDTVIPSFWKESKIAHIIEAIPLEELEAFNTIGYTIGGMMLFPGNRIDNKMTINGARGFHPRIKDRFDYTMECIRRHYSGDESPLKTILLRYDDFFRLFNDFRGFVEFFLLQDIVTEDYSAVEFFSPFDDFVNSPPLPVTKDSYLKYVQLATNFIEARNRRIFSHYN